MSPASKPIQPKPPKPGIKEPNPLPEPDRLPDPPIPDPGLIPDPSGPQPDPDPVPDPIPGPQPDPALRQNRIRQGPSRNRDHYQIQSQCRQQ